MILATRKDRAVSPPEEKRFSLGNNLTQEQIDYYNQYGFILFKKAFEPDQVNNMISAISEIEKNWIQNGYEKINGVPIRYGKDENGNKIIQRFAFTSLHHPYLQQIIKDERVQNLRYLIGEEARLTENERDGMVVNHYVNTEESNYTKLGWHTDGARDIFTHLKLDPMLNVGIYLDDSPLSKGGLRLIPGSHKQTIFNMFFRKKYFVDNNPDKDEFALVAEAGDLTIHSGRMWHRVALSTLKGADSRRRIIYIPIIAGKYKPKNKNSWTPIYHKFQKMVK